MEIADLFTHSNYVNGKWLHGDEARLISVLDKYQQSILGSIPLLGVNYKEEVIQSALDGFDIYRKFSVSARVAKLQIFQDLIKENREFLVGLIIKEAGKPRSYAMAEIERCLATLSATIRESYHFAGEVIPTDFGNAIGKTSYTKRFPCGVVFCITPFNFPANLLLHKIGPALAVGCSVIIKPSPQTPLTAIAFVKLLEQAGYPCGVVNLIQADIPLAEEIVKDNRVAMISFTGSDTIGWHLKSICGKKKITLELGGNASVIVEDSLQLESVAHLVANSAFLYAGQICISTQRILVNSKIYDDFLRLLLQEIKLLKVGDPNEEETIIGPLIDRKSYYRILSWVNEARRSGARILSDVKNDESKNLIAPILLSDVPRQMKVVSQEIFGPVAVIESYSIFEKAIECANETEYGLQAGVFTNSIEKMKYAFDSLEVGGVIINNVPSFRMDHMPYGGVKNSGFGREGVRYAMAEMTDVRLLIY